MYKLCTIHWLYKWNNTLADNAKVLDVVMAMHSMLEYSVNYSKMSGSLWKCCWNEPKDVIADSESFNFKLKFANNNNNNGSSNVEIAVILKYSSNF